MSKQFKTDGNSLVKLAVGTVVSLVTVSLFAFYASKAWKKGQSGEKLF